MLFLLFGCTEQKQFLLVDSDQNLNDLNDVEISSPTNTQALIYQSSTGLWKNLAQAGGGGGGRSYTGKSPITVDNDQNEIGLNVLVSSDWNGTFDGQQGTYYLNWANDSNRLFSLLTLDNNNSFDARYNKTTDSNNTGRLNFQVIANSPWRTEPDTNIFTSGVPDCNSTSFVFGFNSNGTIDCRTDQTGGSADINGTDVNPNFVKITTDLNVLRDANILRLLNVYGNIKGFSNATIAGTLTADSGTFGSGTDTVGIATAARSIVFGAGGDAEIKTPNNLFLRTTGGDTLQLAGFIIVVPETDNVVDLGVDGQAFEYLRLTKTGYARDFNATKDINGMRFCIGTDCRTVWPTDGTTYTAGGNIDLVGTTFSFDDGNFLSTFHIWSFAQRFNADINNFVARSNLFDLNVGGTGIRNNSLLYSFPDLNRSAVSAGCTATQYLGGDGLCHSVSAGSITGIFEGGNIDLNSGTGDIKVSFDDTNFTTTKHKWTQDQNFGANIYGNDTNFTFDKNGFLKWKTQYGICQRSDGNFYEGYIGDLAGCN